MCLTYSTQRTTLFKKQHKDKKYVVCYKCVIIVGWKIVTPYLNEPVEPGNLVSDRQTKRLNSDERYIYEVHHGIHVYLTSGVGPVAGFDDERCSKLKGGVKSLHDGLDRYYMIPVRCLMEDFVAANSFSAVFYKIAISRQSCETVLKHFKRVAKRD